MTHTRTLQHPSTLELHTGAQSRLTTCRTVVGVVEALAWLGDSGALWNMDDAAETVNRYDITVPTETVALLGQLQDRLILICEAAGVEVFDCYPNIPGMTDFKVTCNSTATRWQVRHGNCPEIEASAPHNPRMTPAQALQAEAAVLTRKAAALAKQAATLHRVATMLTLGNDGAVVVTP